jgi:tetratricopeptide (TPR) repeat protein
VTDGPVDARRDASSSGSGEKSLSALLQEFYARAPEDPLAAFEAALRPGATIARFELVRELGRGGFGVVFEARDTALGRAVAFKAIRPGHRTARLDAMIVREAETAAQLQHENIVALHDFGSGPSGPFLVLELLRGETLAQRISRGPLPPRDAVRVAAQVARALAHAHGEGLLHRDLKPSNVFLTEAGGVKVLDLGLAHLFGGGAGVGGTPAYMAPEQWRGEPQDGRTDLFALGVILHEMLAGERPYAVRDDHGTVLDPGAEPRLELKHAPRRLARLVERCIAKSPARRPPSARAVLDELVAVDRSLAPPERRPRTAVIIAGLAVAATLALAGAWRWWHEGPPRLVSPQKILIADFENRTGESVFDGTVESVLGIALDGAAFITSYSRREAQRLADQLRLAGSGLDERRAQLVAAREGVPIVAAGAVERHDERYRVYVRAIDAFTGKQIVEQVEEGPKADVLGAVAKLAVRIRRALGDATPEGLQLKEGETFSAVSIEVAHEYALAQQLQLQGKWDEASQHYFEALKLDPGMARAYSGLGTLAANRGRRADAEKYYKLALAHLDRLTQRERYRTLGAYYLFNQDADHAIDAYDGLVKQYPADYAGLANLALAYSFKYDFKGALETSRKAIAIYPRNVAQRNNVGFFAMYAGKLDEAIREQQRVLELEPRFVNGYIGLALAQLAAGDRDGAEATWRKLEARGEASAAAEGLADLAVYEGRLSDGRAMLDRAIESDLAQRDGDAAARKLCIVAAIHLARGDAAQALAAAERAVKASRASSVLLIAGDIMADAGAEGNARAIADELGARGDGPARMYAEVLRAAIARRERDVAGAVAHGKAALALGDGWLARYALARAHLEAGAHAEAQEQLDQCERRRGEATDVFVDNIPTYRLYAPVRYYLALAEQALGDPAAERVMTDFLAVRRHGEDPLTADARRRLNDGE